MTPEGRHRASDELTRWKMFIYAVAPLAIFWGVLFCVLGYLWSDPTKPHPIIRGTYISLVFGGGMGAILWGSQSIYKACLVAVLLITFYVIRNGMASIPRLALILGAYYMIVVILCGIRRWRRSNHNA